MRFMSTLVILAGLLDDPDAFAAGIDRLASVHTRAGVRAAHFAPMGHALLVTLGEAMGAEFTSELQAAWRAAYDHVAGEMIRRGHFA
jgi:nitric oxide dioxygenase